MYTKRAELVAGLVVLVAIGGLLAFLYFAGGANPLFAEWRHVHVRFDPGYLAPSTGDKVEMNGVEVGRVVEVRQAQEIYRGDAITPEVRRRLDLDETDAIQEARELYVLAVVRMPKDQVIPEGTTAQLSKGLTGQRSFALRPGLSLADLTDAMTKANPIRGGDSVTIDDLLETVDELVAKASSFMDGASDVLGDIRKAVQTAQDRIAAIDTEGLTEEAKAILASVRRSVSQVEQRIGPIADSVEGAASKMEGMMNAGSEAVPVIRDDIREVLETLKKVATRLDGLVEGVEPKVGLFLDELIAVGQNLNNASTQFEGLGPEARRVISDAGGDVDVILKHLKDASHNLLDASEDLRANPWKLANRPEDKEIAYENLRTSLLSYGRAMRDYDGAAQRIQKMLARPDLGDPEVRTQLENALGEFAAAQERVRRTETAFQRMLLRSAPR